MSCRLSRFPGWGSRRTGSRPFGSFGAAALVAGFLALPLVAGGCGSGIRGSDRSEGWYDSQSVQQFAAETSLPAQPVLAPEYVIGVGDVLEVVFLYHNNLTTRDLVVRRDGRISLPYVGDEMAAGITPMVLDSVLTNRFGEILREPNLSV